MDVLDRLREIGADTQTGKDEIAVAREALRNEVRRAKRGRRGGRAWLGFGAVAGAGALAAGIVAVNALGALPQSVAPADTATAAEVLEEVSSSIIQTADPVLEEGQYLRITETTSYLFTDGSSQLAPASEAAVGYDNTSVYYIPADRTGDWIVDGRDPGHITETYGPGGEDLAKQVATYDIGLDGDNVRALPGGRQGPDGTGPSLEGYADRYEEMPREPDALVAWLREDIAKTGGANGGPLDGPIDDRSVALAITNALWLNLPPAEIRSALFGALAQLDSYTLLDSGDGRAAFERVAPEGSDNEGQRSGFAVDTDTGLMTDYLTFRLPGDDEIAPGVPELRISISQEVVDSAPEPTE